MYIVSKGRPYIPRGHSRPSVDPMAFFSRVSFGVRGVEFNTGFFAVCRFIPRPTQMAYRAYACRGVSMGKMGTLCRPIEIVTLVRGPPLICVRV